MADINKTNKHAEYAQLLEAKLTAITLRAIDRDAIKITPQADPMDNLQAITDVMVVVGLESSTARMRRDILLAIARIKDGSYGECLGCDEPIASARLRAVPWAKLCIACQEMEDRKAREAEIMLNEEDVA